MADFSRALQEELGWRRKELHNYKSWVDGAGLSRKQAILRGAVAVTYAHWEGFVKSASEKYLSYIIDLRLDYDQLKPNFIALGLKTQLADALRTDSIEPLVKLVQFIRTGLSVRARFSFRKAIETKSNLSVAVFQAIVAALGLDYRSEFATAEKPIIERLLELRNGIAHGEWQYVDSVEFDLIYGKIDSLLVLFSNDLDNAASLGLYKAAS